MELLDLVAEINRYCTRKGIKTIEITVSELTNMMLDDNFKED